MHPAAYVHGPVLITYLRDILAVGFWLGDLAASTQRSVDYCRFLDWSSPHPFGSFGAPPVPHAGSCMWNSLQASPRSASEASPTAWSGCPIVDNRRWRPEALTTPDGEPLHLGDFLPEGGRRPRVYTIDTVDPEHALIDLVPPQDLLLYQLLAAKRPVARSHHATISDREACVLLAAAFFLDLRKEQIRAFTTGPQRLALTPPCSRCALPTGSWCDLCDRPLCSSCDDAGATPCCARCARPQAWRF